jgi:galactitol PTS system EIIA component
MSEMYFDDSIILLNLEADNKEEVLTRMGQNLQTLGLVKDSFTDAIIAREAEFATGLPTKGASVAIPHTDVEHVNRKTISVAVLKDPVDFCVMGDDEETTPVRIVFMLAMDKPHDQLSLLQKLMQIFQDEATLASIVEATSEAAVMQVLADKLEFDFKGGE